MIKRKSSSHTLQLSSQKLTDKSDGPTDDAFGDLLDLDRADVIHFAGERTAGNGRPSERHVNPVLARQTRAELHRQTAVAVVFDLRRHRGAARA